MSVIDYRCTIHTDTRLQKRMCSKNIWAIIIIMIQYTNYFHAFDAKRTTTRSHISQFTYCSCVSPQSIAYCTILWQNFHANRSLFLSLWLFWKICTFAFVCDNSMANSNKVSHGSRFAKATVNFTIIIILLLILLTLYNMI